MTGAEVDPYARIAGVYDALLGDRMLPLFLRNLRILTARHRMRLRRVADVGCGSGSFVVALRRRGIGAVGVDRSRSMIALARRRSRRVRRREGHGRGVRAAPTAPRGDEGFRVQDLRALRLDRPVDLITCNFDVLNYLRSERELVRAFRAFAANLVPGGHVIFDVIVSTPPLRRGERRVRRVRARGRETVWIVDLLPGGFRRVAVWVRGPGPHSPWRRETHVQRAHPACLVVRALARAGLRPLGVYDARTLGPPCRGRPRNVFIARRPRAVRRHYPGARP